MKLEKTAKTVFPDDKFLYYKPVAITSHARP